MICDTETLKTFTQTTDSFFMPLKNLKNKQKTYSVSRDA